METENRSNARLSFSTTAVGVEKLEAARVLSTAAKALILLAFATGGVGRVLLGEFTPLSVAILAVVGIGLLVYSYALSIRCTTVPGDVSVGTDGLELISRARHRSIARRDVLSALWIQRSVGSAFVVFVEIEIRSSFRRLGSGSRTRGDRLIIRMSDEATAQRFVELLGFGPVGCRVRADLGTPRRRLIHVLIAAISYATGLASAALVGNAVSTEALIAYLYGLSGSAVVALIIHELLKTVLRAPEVTVGRDGVIVRRGLSRSFFGRSDLVRLDRLAGVPPAVNDTARLALNERLQGMLLDSERRDAIVRLAQPADDGDSGPNSRITTYDRAGRTAADWNEHLRALIHRGDYRTGASSVEEAAAVLASGSATPDQRIGAALALRIAGAPPDRIRLATHSLVEDGVRTVISGIADAEDEPDLLRALGSRR